MACVDAEHEPIDMGELFQTIVAADEKKYANTASTSAFAMALMASSGQAFDSLLLEQNEFRLSTPVAPPKAAVNASSGNRWVPRLSFTSLPPPDVGRRPSRPSQHLCGELPSFALAASHRPSPALRPPNRASVVRTAVKQQMSFLYGKSSANGKFDRKSVVSLQSHRPGTAPEAPTEVTVALHVYDLSRGLVKKVSSELFGMPIEGMYHSGVVCYGMEFYFEGGIAFTKAGLTRFGPKYRTIILGTTTKSICEFLQWVRKREDESYQVSHYQLTEHNCHHFSNEAVGWLLGQRDPAPRFLFTSIEDILKAPVAKLTAKLMLRIAGGVQNLIAKSQLDRVEERLKSVNMITTSSVACGVNASPPPVVVLFRMSSRQCSSGAILLLVPYCSTVFSAGKLRDDAVNVVRAFSQCIYRGDENLSWQLAEAYSYLVASALATSPLVMWGPVLDGLRIALLHKVFLIQVVFSGPLLGHLRRAVVEFCQLAPDGRIALLRTLCNFASGAHGAALYHDSRLCYDWVSLVGQALFDENAAVVYTGACLAVNIAVAFVTLSQPSLNRDILSHGKNHCFCRLITVVLYHLRCAPRERSSEPIMNMLLLSVFFFASSGTVALELFETSPFTINYDSLLRHCRSNESRAILCILRTLQDLYG